METRRLDELCVQITDCPHSTPQWLSSGKLVLRNFNIHNGRIDLSNVSYTDDETFFARNKRATPIPGDIVMSREAPMGEVAIIPNGFECCLGQRMVLLHPDATVCNGKFLMYSLLSPFVQKQIKRSDTTGSVVSNLCIPDLCALEIPYVNIERQECIVALLSDIDAKIDNNNAIAAELEGMAKDLYDYWFVQFDFPDENGKPYKSSGGKMVWNEELKREIPEGWEVDKLGNRFAITMGTSPTGNCINETQEGIPFYQGKADFGFRYPSIRTYTTKPIRFAKHDDTLLSVRAPVGALNKSIKRCCIGRGIAAIHSEEYPSLAYYECSSLQPQFEKYNGDGTTFGCIGKDDLHNISSVIPPASIANRFERIVSQLDKMIEVAETESTELTSLRDFLLPMLMNGQVKVKGA